MQVLLEITFVIPLKWYVFFTFVIKNCLYVELDEVLEACAFILQQYFRNLIYTYRLFLCTELVLFVLYFVTTP